MRRTCLALLLLTSLAVADVKDAYYQAKKKRGAEQQEFAAGQAALYAGSVSGTDYLYLGFLYQYAKDRDSAISAFRSYLREAKPKAKNRPRALFEIANAQLGQRKYNDVLATVKEFMEKHGGGAYLKWIRYCEGRAQRAAGNAGPALEAFKKAQLAGHKTGGYEVTDCLIQLGRYADIKPILAETNTETGRWKSLAAALPNLGQELPKKLDIGFWAGRELGMGEIKGKPTVWSFWSTKVGNMRDPVHDITNALAEHFGSKINILGAAVYLQFDPIHMRSNPAMEKSEEESYVEGWKEQYKLQYDVILLNDNKLHDLCGVDPAYPVLPAFGVSDKKGVLRYVRVGPEDATLEAITAMVDRLLKE